MLRRRGYFVTLGLLFAAFLLSANADNSVHILSKYHQLLTSTTLKWLPVAHYNPDEPKEIVVGGFEIATDGEDAHAPREIPFEFSSKPQMPRAARSSLTARAQPSHRFKASI